MNKHRITSDERAVSGLVGEVLLIGIVIVAIGLIAVSVYSYLNKDPDTPHIEVDGVANMGTNEIHIKHQGGDPIECRNLRVLVSVNGTLLDPYDDNSPLRWGLSDEGIGNFERWTLGNILVLDTMPEVDITDDDEIRVTIVSRSSNRVVVSGEVFGGLFGNASINRIPIADAGDDQTDGLCANTTWAEVGVWFDGSGSYDPDNPTGGIYRGIVSWQWDFDDGNESDVLDTPYVWHNYSVNRTYEVELTVTDVDGATDTDTCIVTILPPANLTADAGPEQWVGVGAEVRLDGSGSTGCIKEWQWEFGDGDNETVNASTTTHTYSDEGDYTVNLTVVEDHTGKTANDNATIHVMAGFKIVGPHDGDWVSDLVPIDARAFDIETDYVNFNISSVSNEVSYSHSATNNSGEAVEHNTTSYTYDWDTSSLECGNYTIKATAYTEDYPEMTDQITVCVCNVLDLMGFWRFDDGTDSTTANDSSCNRNHGIIYGDPVGIIDGWHALMFNGSEYIEVANSISLARTNKTRIDAWANSSDAGEQYVLAKGGMVFESIGDTVVRQDETGYAQNFGATWSRAQTFELDHDAVLDSVSIHIKKVNSGITGDIKVSICENEGAVPGTEVASITIPDGNVSTSYAWITMPFNCNLTGSNTYWLVLESPDASGLAGSYQWDSGHPNPYSNGEAYYNTTTSSWTTDTLVDVDMTFELNITPVPSTYTDRISMPDPDNFKYLVYYGYLNATTMNWSESGLELVMMQDDNEAEIQKVRNAGVDVYYYIMLGTSYKNSADKDVWEQNITDEINRTCDYVDGYIWDEVTPGHYDQNYYTTAPVPYTETNTSIDFNRRLDRLNEHAHSKGKKTVANGVRYYAVHNGSDYYMWESFMSTYNDTASPMYYCYGNFFQRPTWANTPYTWVNGIERWEYLRDNNVLHKTLVHSFGDPLDDNKSVYGYIASRVLGVKGFSYADITNFANGTTAPLTRLAEGLRWDLGTRMSYDVGNTTPGCLSGRFTNGYVTDCVNWSSTHNSTNYTTDLISDPLTAHLLDSSSRVTGLDLCLIRGQVDFMHGVLRSSTDITGWDSWHQNATAAVTLDALNGTATLYVDDIPAAERTFPMGLPFDFTGSNLTIGANNNTGAYGFNGSIEEVRIYNSSIIVL